MRETRRLMLQDELLRPLTRQAFQEAGLASGMKVFDVGSGAGDVALLAAELVGPNGSVVGIDLDPEVLETARARAAAAERTNVTFQVGDVATQNLDRDFDAVVGRAVLMHLADPLATLRQLKGLLRPGGVLIFQEIYAAAPWVSYPHSRSLTQLQRARGEAEQRRSAMDYEMGLKLHGLFLEAGLSAPRLRADALVGGGPDWPGYTYIAETVRTLLPLWLRLGSPTAREIDVETLADRLRAEIGDVGGTLLLQPFVAASSRIGEH